MMDQSNGISDDNHSITSSLKELLKISNSPSSPGMGSATGSVDHDNAASASAASGDAVNEDESKVDPDLVIIEPSSSTAADDKIKFLENIDLKTIGDGSCVQLHEYESTIIANVNTENSYSTSASSKVRFKTVTKFEWDHQYYLGSLISVTDKFMAYCVKGRISNSVRVINRQNTSDRILLKGFSGVITDIAFSHSQSNILSAVDNMGNLIVWRLIEITGKMHSEIKLHLDGEKELENPATHRILWIPHHHSGNSSSGADSEPPDYGVAGIMTLFYNNTAEIWDINYAFELVEQLDSVKVEKSQVDHAYLTIHNRKDVEMTDCELSPFGNVLAAASSDGLVKFWQFQIDQQETPSCLHEMTPHDGRPVSSVRFCDELNQDEPRVFWRFLLTGCNRNSELKMWCAVSWNCLQVIRFKPSAPEYPLPEMNLSFLRSANFLVLSDIHRKVLYVMQVHADLKREKASITSMAHYTLTSPILSLAIVGVEDRKFESSPDDEENLSADNELDNYLSDASEHKLQEEGAGESDGQLEGVLVKLLTIQRRSLQSLDVRFISNDSGDEKPTKQEAEEDIDADVTDEPERSTVVDGQTSPDPVALNSFLAAGDNMATLSKGNHAKSIDEKEILDLDRTSDSVVTEKIVSPPLVRSPSDSNEFKVDVPTTPPVLLTPDAFLGASRSGGKPADAVSSGLASISPFEAGENPSYSQSFEDSKDNPLSKLFAGISSQSSEKSFKRDMVTKTPPSSPVVPSSQNTSVQTPTAAAELLQSMHSSVVRSSVKSPDLISSASAPDDAQVDVNPPPLSAPPGLPSRPLNSASPFSVIDSPNIFSSTLVPVMAPSNSSSWPKAPDVTMSHLLPAASSTPSDTVNPSTKPSAGGALLFPANMDSSRSSISAQHQVPEQEISLKDAFSEFRRQQETTLKEHKQKLDAMANKQKQFQKQCDAMWKRSDQQGERLENAVKSVNQSQLEFRNDLKVGQLSVADALVAKVDKAVKTEIKRTVLPGVTSSIDEIRDKLSSTVAQQLSATDSVLRETIEKSIKSKEMSNKISMEMTKLLHERVHSILPDVLMKTMVPAFERSCQVMFQQLSATYHKGLEELMKQLEKQMQFRLKNDFDKLQQAIKEANDASRQLQAASKQLQGELSASVQKQITQGMDGVLKNFEEKMATRIAFAVKQQQEQDFTAQRHLIGQSVKDVIGRVLDEKLATSSTSDGPTAALTGMTINPGAALRRTSVASQQESILRMLQRGDVNSAFQTALNAANLGLVMYVCETADPGMIFNVIPCPLEQPILLSLIQQLSSELATKTEIKMRYLQEAVMNLDRHHKVTHEHMNTVLRTLVQNLNAATRDPNQALPKQLKMLAMAAQSLMG